MWSACKSARICTALHPPFFFSHSLSAGATLSISRIFCNNPTEGDRPDCLSVTQKHQLHSFNRCKAARKSHEVSIHLTASFHRSTTACTCVHILVATKGAGSYCCIGRIQKYGWKKNPKRFFFLLIAINRRIFKVNSD